MYDVLTIADYVIAYYKNVDSVVSNLKLQKILYFLQAAFLIEMDKPLFDSDIEAWSFGPVIPVVYDKFKLFGAASIPDTNVKMPTILNKDSEIIDGLLERVKDLSSTLLTQITLHQTPWIRNYSKYSHRIIPNAEIKEYFMED